MGSDGASLIFLAQNTELLSSPHPIWTKLFLNLEAEEHFLDPDRRGSTSVHTDKPT